MGVKNFHKRNGKNGVHKHLIHPKRKRRVDAVSEIKGRKDIVKALFAKGRRRKGPFTRTQLQLRRDWLSRLRSQIRNWDGIGTFQKQIPTDILRLLTGAIQADMTEEYSKLLPGREIAIANNAFIISGGVRDT